MYTIFLTPTIYILPSHTIRPITPCFQGQAPVIQARSQDAQAKGAAAAGGGALLRRHDPAGGPPGLLVWCVMCGVWHMVYG